MSLPAWTSCLLPWTGKATLLSLAWNWQWIWALAHASISLAQTGDRWDHKTSFMAVSSSTLIQLAESKMHFKHSSYIPCVTYSTVMWKESIWSSNAQRWTNASVTTCWQRWKGGTSGWWMWSGIPGAPQRGRRGPGPWRPPLRSSGRSNLRLPAKRKSLTTASGAEPLEFRCLRGFYGSLERIPWDAIPWDANTFTWSVEHFKGLKTFSHDRCAA